MWGRTGTLLAIALLSLIWIGVLASCQGNAGPSGLPGVSTGTVTGIVTNSLTKQAVDGVNVAPNPAIKPSVTTTATGNYTIELPIGSYSVTYTKAGFATFTQTVALVAGQTVTKSVSIVPSSRVAVSAGAAETSSPGGSVSLKATVTPLDGSTLTGVSWKQTTGPKASIDSPSAQTTTVRLAPADQYKANFLNGLDRLNTWGVQPVNPFTLGEGNTASFEIMATTSSGVYKSSVDVTVILPYTVTLGIQNVPVGEPVLLNGKVQSAYQWALLGPGGSKSVLSDDKTRNPSFTPDVKGKYVISERTSNTSFNVYAGTWSGAITGLDAKGKPVTAGCSSCHDGKTASDKQFAAWKNSGHAQIFTENINDPNGHWSIACASCHTVGYDPAVTNGGFDEAAKAENWQVPPHGQPGYYASMFKQYSKTASLANIQCENCHGPNDTLLHATGVVAPERISLAADLCGSCHGEPLRHGRFQQWQESTHSNYDLAVSESGSASCARCHTGQGFLLWLKQGDLTKQIQGANGNATTAELTAMGISGDTVVPQTCAVCHDPHQQGTISGNPTDATVRVVDETPLLPAGFQASVVGKGALCMACHNTRNGIHNESALPTAYQAPHTAAQADVLMGENAYFVTVGSRSPHSYIQDTCVTCHMEKTPPPPEFSYEGGGTNHSFKASITICGQCHTPTLNGEALQAGIKQKIDDLAAAEAAYLLKKLPAQVTLVDYTAHNYSGKAYDMASNAFVVNKDSIVSIQPVEPHGQQGFIFILKSPVVVTYSPAGEQPHTMSLAKVSMQLGSITDGTKPVIALTDPLVKAGWNYFLFESDGSFGVHNPGFAAEALEAAIAALK